ncbi:glycosyltransferase family 2 protein [Corynebacterium aquatimens]|uniref:Glycosyltransferase involved in cell wall biosynthesis n=1 Tax=Corynebacterium aquatimens TaxID=1190508 RepID=A0A931E1K0_9CORY|nr:glycosyltransferase [Corynebacterium aquatimens]MBG6122197.1 glycosyltransferase involved in cell wall biosynthesis [Corynebacterium aquatimens]
MRNQLKTPAVSVIIPHYNNPSMLEHVIAGVRAQDYGGPIEIIVADDGSDTLPTPIEDERVPVTVVGQENLGFRAAAARNLGASHATGEVLAFLDGDTIPDPGYLSAVVPHVTSDSRAVVVGARRTGPERTEPEWLRDAWRQTNNLRRGDDTSWRYIISSVLTCSRPFFWQVGGFDATFIGYGGEDWEFGFRAWNAGATFVHEPTATATHPDEDFGSRHDNPVEEARVKNVESIALAQRITHPIARPAHARFDTTDIGVHIIRHVPADFPGVLEHMIDSWLAIDSTVYIDRDLQIPELFASDPRVRSERSDWKFMMPLHRINVDLLGPWALDNIEDFFRHSRDTPHTGGWVCETSGMSLVRAQTARGIALGLPPRDVYHDDAGVRWINGPVRLERTFAGW